MVDSYILGLVDYALANGIIEKEDYISTTNNFKDTISQNLKQFGTNLTR